MLMELWYQCIEFLFPFSWSAYQFMKNALLAIILVAPLYGLLSTMIVNNKMAFFSDSLGHSALTGIGIGVLFGIQDPRWSMLLFAILFSFLLVWVKNRSRSSIDTTIGVFSATAIALGIVILSVGGNFANYSSYLIGDLLSVTVSDITLILAVFIGILMIWLFLFNRFLILSINATFAHSRGVSTLWTEFIFVALIAVIVTVSIQWVGILVINALLLLPAAAARNISKNVRQYHTFSLGISIFSGVSGLFVSYYFETATGATIVLLLAVIYGLTFFVKRS